MHFKLLSDKDLKAIDALRDSYGGAEEIKKQIDAHRDYETRKRIAGDKGFGEMLAKAEDYAADFAKLPDWLAKNKLEFSKKGIATAQVSGFQGAYVTADCMRRVAENKDLLWPREMISVVALTEIISRGQSRSLFSATRRMQSAVT